MNKVITIIIPTYNMEAYLRRCLDSLLIADKELVEVLVVNDGSQDGSSAIAHSYEALYPQTFRVIDKENGNYGSCVNRALREAKGKYVKLLDADDWYTLQSFQYVVTRLQTLDVDMVLTNHAGINSEGQETHSIHLPLPKDQEMAFADLLSLNRQTPLQMHWIIYRRELLNRIAYTQTEGVSYTDTEWVLYPSVAVERWIYLDVCLYNYVEEREGQTMAPAQLGKTAPVFLSLVETLNRRTQQDFIPKDEVHRTFVADYMAWMLQFAYDRFLLYRRTELADLVAFDQKLEPKMHQVLDQRRLKGIPYIKMWHERGGKALPQWFYVYIDLRASLRNFKHKYLKKKK